MTCTCENKVIGMSRSMKSIKGNNICQNVKIK